MYCGRCGAQNPEGNAFCGACGQRLVNAQPVADDGYAHAENAQYLHDQSEEYERELPVNPAAQEAAAYPQQAEDEAQSHSAGEYGRLAHREYVPRPRRYTQAAENTRAGRQQERLQVEEQDCFALAAEEEKQVLPEVPKAAQKPEAKQGSTEEEPEKIEPDAEAEKMVFVEDEDTEEPAKAQRIHRRRDPGLADARPVQPRRTILPEIEEDIEEEKDDSAETDVPVVIPQSRQIPRFGAGTQRRHTPIVREFEEEDDEEDEEDLFSTEKPSRAIKAYKKEAETASMDEKVTGDEEDTYDESEYDPTSPREKAEGGSPLMWIFITAAIVVLAALGAIVGYLNCTNSDKLPPYLQFDCAPKEEDSETEESPDPNGAGTLITDQPTMNPGQKDGEDVMFITVKMNPGEVVTFYFPDGEEYSHTADKAEAAAYEFPIPFPYFYPDIPLDESVYTVYTKVTVQETAGTERHYDLDSFTLTFSPVSLELTEPTAEEVTAGLMADVTNNIHLKGNVSDAEVTVTVNGVSLPVYAGGVFEGDYTLTSEEGSELLVIRAEKKNHVAVETQIAVDTYVYVAQPMILEVDDGRDAMRAINNRVSVRGTTLPGATLKATSDTTSVLCGSVSVDESGKFSFEVTFDSKYKGFANISIEATMSGYEDKSVVCIPYDVGSDRQEFVKNFGKSYFELGLSGFTIDKLLADTDRTHAFRIAAVIREVYQVGNQQVLRVETTTADKTTFFVYNLHKDSDLSSRVGKTYKFYGQLNGTYPDTAEMVFLAYFIVAA